MVGETLIGCYGTDLGKNDEGLQQQGWEKGRLKDVQEDLRFVSKKYYLGDSGATSQDQREPNLGEK